jgi:hypothetical protein
MGAGDDHLEYIRAANWLSTSTNWKAPEEYRTVIHLFAAMAIRTTVSGAIP